MNARTTVFTGNAGNVEIREYPVPEADPGAAIIRMTQAGLCGTDLHIWRGEYYSTDPGSSATSRGIPLGGRPLGHEGAGVIHKLGSGLTRDCMGNPLAEGDRVTWHPTFPCHQCSYCLSGDLNMCPNRRIAYRTEAGQPPYFLGTFSDYLYLPAGHPIFKVPDELADDEVVSLNCAMATVFQGLVSAGLRQGHTVVVFGAGGLGLYTAAFAAGFGARQVISIDSQRARLELARELGATATIDLSDLSTADARVQRILDLTKGHGADIVMDAAGAGNIVQEGITMLRPMGSFVEVGNIARGRMEQISPTALIAGKRIIGSAGARPDLIPRIMDFLVTFHDRLPVGKVISHHFSLGDINRAFLESEWSGRATSVVRSAIIP